MLSPSNPPLDFSRLAGPTTRFKKITRATFLRTRHRLVSFTRRRIVKRRSNPLFTILVLSPPRPLTSQVRLVHLPWGTDLFTPRYSSIRHRQSSPRKSYPPAQVAPLSPQPLRPWLTLQLSSRATRSNVLVDITLTFQTGARKPIEVARVLFSLFVVLRFELRRVGRKVS